MPALLLLTGPSQGQRVELATELTLGRSPSCDIPLEDPKVSRRHARVFLRGGQARIRDLASRNGTTVNGETVTGEALLLPADRIQVGDTLAVFEAGEQVHLEEGALHPAKGGPAKHLQSRVVEGTLNQAALVLLAA